MPPSTKTQIVFPDDLLAEVDRLVGGRKRSDLVAAAMREKLARERFQKVLQKAAGSWSAGRHPSALDVQAVDRPIASRAASLIREYRRRGITLDFVDASVAATCLLKAFRLATLNRRHYFMQDLQFVSL